MHKLFLRCLRVRAYAFSTPAKSGVGIGLSDMHMAMPDAPASFLSSASTHTQIMVGWAGEPKGSPVSMCAGKTNPAQLTTSKIGLFGGENISLHMEAAIMATTPTPLYPRYPRVSVTEVHHV